MECLKEMCEIGKIFFKKLKKNILLLNYDMLAEERCILKCNFFQVLL